MSGIATGETDPASISYLAKNIAGGELGITNTDASPIAGLKGQYIICSDGIAGKYVKQLDTALDDGNTKTGFMSATVSGTSSGGEALETHSIADGVLYLVCMGV